MNYTRIYNSLTSTHNTTDLYTENHHIIPRCMGGTDDKDNLVRLSGRTHFVCHWLLTKIYPDNEKLAFAFWAMCNKNNKRKATINSRTYQTAKEHFSKANSKIHTGKSISENQKDLSRQRMLKSNPHKPGEDSHRFGIAHTDETKQRISNTKRNNPFAVKGFSGYFVTPNGTYSLLRDAAKANNLSVDVVRYRCKNSKKTITTKMAASPSLSDGVIGSTFQQLGWDFAPVQF